MLVTFGLFTILALVLSLPFLVKKVEEELELFLFAMGCAAVTLTGQWDMHLLREALRDPVFITVAVLSAGFLFKVVQKTLAGHLNMFVRLIGMKLFAFLVIVILGFLSSVITAIIASLVLVEIVHCLHIPREIKIRLVILACFSIGLGAALTPVGEPLSTIVVAKLKGQPYHADFFFLARFLGGPISAGIGIFGLLGMLVSPAKYTPGSHVSHYEKETNKDIFLRSGKVYVFVMALIFLGTGFKPIIDAYISKISYQGLYWINIVSAVLDNATLAAAEIGPSMQIVQLKAALLGLLIAGGMLIPGNIPNIIAAGKLKIKSSEWAIIGVPLGLVVMGIGFFFLQYLRP